MQYDEPTGVRALWQPELDRIAPRSVEGHSWLSLQWEPGEPWAPVGRWVIWEMTTVHPERTPRHVYEALHGPNPRNFGFYDRTLKRFVRTKEFPITRKQWEVFRETGCYGRCIWVVQGKVGGHKRFWTDVESQLATIHGGPQAPPAPGDLCYAEPDARTIEKLAHLDQVRKYGDLLRLLSNRDEVRNSLDRRERETAKEVAMQVWGWLDEQAGEAMTFTRDQLFEIHCGSSRDIPEPDYDQGKEEFIESVADAAVH